MATDGTLVNQIGISWTAPLTADHYHVYKDGVAGVGTLVHNSSATSFTDAITDDDTHTYYIYSANSEDANSATYISDTGYRSQAPTAPTVGTPSVLSTTSIRWNFTDNASNETGFKVHDSSQIEKTASASANLSYLDESGLSANTQYTRHIHAYNGAGNSTASNNTSKITLAATPSLASSKDAGIWLSSSSIAFSSNRIFGEGGVAYYRYAFNEISGYLVSGADTQWAGGVLSIPINTSGLYYLNVNGYNADNVATAQVTYGPYQYDIEDPEVEITSHSSGDYVKGVIGLTAVASDNIALSNVSFYDNSLSNRIGDNNAAFDTRSLEGARTIYAKATDTAGNTKVTSIILNIDNIAPSASLPDQNPGSGDNGSSGEGKIDEVKKGSKVSIFYKIKENNDYASVEVIIYRRYKRANFEKLRNKTLSLISEKRALTKLKAKLQKRKDSISKKKLKSVKRKIESLKKKFNKHNPYRIKKTITYDLGEVKTNKTVVFKYPARKRGVFRIVFAIQDKASNKSASLLEKWLKVK